jgi:hypothetical protein
MYLSASAARTRQARDDQRRSGIRAWAVRRAVVLGLFASHPPANCLPALRKRASVVTKIPKTGSKLHERPSRDRVFLAPLPRLRWPHRQRGVRRFRAAFAAHLGHRAGRGPLAGDRRGLLDGLPHLRHRGTSNPPRGRGAERCHVCGVERCLLGTACLRLEAGRRCGRPGHIRERIPDESAATGTISCAATFTGAPVTGAISCATTFTGAPATGSSPAESTAATPTASCAVPFTGAPATQSSPAESTATAYPRTASSSPAARGPAAVLRRPAFQLRRKRHSARRDQPARPCGRQQQLGTLDLSTRDGHGDAPLAVL